MIPQALTLSLLLAVASATSTSHVSISYGNGASISYGSDSDPSYHPAAPADPAPVPSYAPAPAPAQSYAPAPAPSYAPAPAPTTTEAPATTHAPIYHKPAPVYHKPAPVYHKPAYKPKPAYHPAPAYHQPSYKPKPVYHPAPAYKPHHEPEVPACSELTNSTWCLEDAEYPEYEIKSAIGYHLDKFNHLYADVADLDTELSVERPNSLDEETYLCPSETSYIQPLRAQNTEGKWRVIINDVHAHYKTFTQTARIEECLSAGDECPKVPSCYESKCLQKSIYHRFVVYDPYDQYFPFAIETFKLPASCACLLGAYTLDH